MFSVKKKKKQKQGGQFTWFSSYERHKKDVFFFYVMVLLRDLNSKLPLTDQLSKTSILVCRTFFQ